MRMQQAPSREAVTIVTEDTRHFTTPGKPVGENWSFTGPCNWKV